MNFEEYLKRELKKPAHEYYDKNGNSARAVVTRGLAGEILMQYRLYPERLREAILSVNYGNTPIGLVIQLPIMIIFSPVLPVIAGICWHKKSVKEFMVEYAQHVKD